MNPTSEKEVTWQRRNVNKSMQTQNKKGKVWGPGGGGADNMAGQTRNAHPLVYLNDCSFFELARLALRSGSVSLHNIQNYSTITIGSEKK